MTRLSRIVLLLRDVKHGIKFYGHGLGLKVDTMTDEFARLTTTEGLAVELNRAETEAQCSSGYSPMLTFEVDDMDTMVPRLIQLGGILDGAIRYLPYGKVASLRSPHGHMIGLYQRSGLSRDAETNLAAAAAAENHLQRHNEGKGGLPTDNPSDK